MKEGNFPTEEFTGKNGINAVINCFNSSEKTVKEGLYGQITKLLLSK
jgi:hypothetical protein